MGDGLKIVLAFDQGPGVGLGHRRRMEALAGELQLLGLEPWYSEATPVLSGDAVVVDSYRVRADGEGIDAPFVAAIDDLYRDLAVDLLVDPSPGADGAAHVAARARLIGAEFALVDPALQPRRKTTPPRVREALVAVGGTDDAGHGAAVAGRLARRCPDILVRLAVGPWGSQEVPAGVVPVVTTQGLGEELLRSDLVVTAGGVTMLEALRVGCPTVAIAVAANQARAVRGAAAAGAVVESSIADADVVAADIAHDYGQRTALSRAARRLIDGQGARRVAREIRASLSDSPAGE